MANSGEYSSSYPEFNPDPPRIIHTDEALNRTISDVLNMLSEMQKSDVQYFEIYDNMYELFWLLTKIKRGPDFVPTILPVEFSLSVDSAVNFGLDHRR